MLQNRGCLLPILGWDRNGIPGGKVWIWMFCFLHKGDLFQSTVRCLWVAPIWERVVASLY